MASPSSDEWRVANRKATACGDTRLPWHELERLVHLDPAGRGLASFRQDNAPLDAGQLCTSAVHLAEHAQAVGIVTGFCVDTPSGPLAETDGPPGALFLARALAQSGVEVSLISDRHALRVLEVGCELCGTDRQSLLEIPLAEETGIGGAQHWAEEFLASQRGGRLTHLIAIERPGRSHTAQSIAAQAREGSSSIERFLREVPAEHRDVCHNMRGESIEPFTAEAHWLFDIIRQRRLPICTMAIGDGGNEIGMGRFAWETLVEAVGTPVAPRIISRVATDFTLIAGVSNWGAYALALSIARLRGAERQARNWTSQKQRELIEALIHRAGAIDGLTRRREPTVDGLPLDVYLRSLDEMRTLLAID